MQMRNADVLKGSERFSISVDDNLLMVVVRFLGDCSLQDHCQARNCIAEQIVRSKVPIHRVLVDMTESPFPEVTCMEEYGFAESLSKYFLIGTRVAIVEPRFRRDYSFAENVACNRGIRTKFFRQRCEAIGWLTDQVCGDEMERT